MKLKKAGILELAAGIGLISISLILGQALRGADIALFLVTILGGIEIGRYIEAKLGDRKN
jgi:hypothetical protein